MYSAASAGLPFGLAMKSWPKPLAPPDSLKPGKSGGRKCVAIGPTNEPPRALRAASRSKPARMALRTLMLSSGLIVVLSGNHRKPPLASVESWSLLRRAARAGTLGGGVVVWVHFLPPPPRPAGARP